MKSKSFIGMKCSIAGALEAIGDRWSFLVIRDISFGLRRFDELQASTGIPPATLTSRLKHLIGTGIVETSRYSERPPRDEYRLTVKGRDLWKVTLALREWGDRWDATGFAAPTMTTVDRETGRALELAAVDVRTGTRVPHHRVALRAGPGADRHTKDLLERRNGGAR